MRIRAGAEAEKPETLLLHERELARTQALAATLSAWPVKEAKWIGLAMAPAWSVTVACALTLMLLASVVLGTQIRQVLTSLIDDTWSSRDRERMANAEHARELVALSGEIGHELKNPPRSHQGLGLLLARDPTVTICRKRSIQMRTPERADRGELRAVPACEVAECHVLVRLPTTSPIIRGSYGCSGSSSRWPSC